MSVERPNLIVYGKVIALSQVQEIKSQEAGKPAMKKQELYVDCTKTDSITGEIIGSENKPVLEFGGEKLVDKIAALAIKQGDVVGIRFAIQGTPYQDKTTGKNKVYTAIRCYDIEIVRRAGEAPSPAPAPATQQATQQPQAGTQQPTTMDGKDGLPF